MHSSARMDLQTVPKTAGLVTPGAGSVLYVAQAATRPHDVASTHLTHSETWSAPTRLGEIQTDVDCL